MRISQDLSESKEVNTVSRDLARLYDQAVISGLKECGLPDDLEWVSRHISIQLRQDGTDIFYCDGMPVFEIKMEPDPYRLLLGALEEPLFKYSFTVKLKIIYG